MGIETGQNIEIIAFLSLISALEATHYTPVDNHIFPPLHLYSNWFHNTLAGSPSIARINIHMLAPEALRAVVRIARPLH